LTISPTFILKDRTGDKWVKSDEGGQGSKTSLLRFLENKKLFSILKKTKISHPNNYFHFKP
jgi:hypothetical protein